MLGFPAYIFSKRLWMTTLPDSLFEDGYFAFRTPNLTNAEFDRMEWALKWKGRFPYVLPCGMLFQDGRRMVQLAAYEDLVRLPGSYWVAPDGKTSIFIPLKTPTRMAGSSKPPCSSTLFNPRPWAWASSGSAD